MEGLFLGAKGTGESGGMRAGQDDARLSQNEADVLVQLLLRWGGRFVFVGFFSHGADLRRLRFACQQFPPVPENETEQRNPKCDRGGGRGAAQFVRSDKG